MCPLTSSRQWGNNAKVPLTATSRNGESRLAFLRFLVESWPSPAARFLAMAAFVALCSDADACAACTLCVVLKQLAAEQRASGYRQPRLPVHTRAKVTTEEGTSDIELVDLSQSGAGFVHDGALEVGKEVDLALASGIHRKAIVRWARGTRGGLWLTQPLDRADLESIRRFQS